MKNAANEPEPVGSDPIAADYFWIAGRRRPMSSEAPATAVISSISVNPPIFFEFMIFLLFIRIIARNLLTPGVVIFMPTLINASDERKNYHSILDFSSELRR